MTLAAALATLAASVTLAGCAGSRSAADRESSAAPASAAALVGTWRLASAREANGTVHTADAPFFMRFYEDGRAASWPVPPRGGVSRGVYSFQGGRISLPDAPEAGSLPLRLTDTEMSYTGAEGVTLVYRRVTPDLEPGQMP